MPSHAGTRIWSCGRRLPVEGCTRLFVRTLVGSLVLTGLACSKTEAPVEPPTVNIYNWADYISPKVIERFEREYKVKVVYDTFDSNETVLAKLQSGFTGYDVIFPTDYMVTILAKSGLLQPLEKAKLPNLVNIDPMLLDKTYDPGNVHSIPYMFGTTGIGVRTDLIKTPITSWMDLFKPGPELQGKITMLNDRKDLVGAALKALGYSINSTDPKQVEEAKQLLLSQKPFVKTYDSTTYKNNLGVGEVAVGLAWSGDMASLFWNGTKTVQYILPKEGAAIYCENMTIPKGAPHVELAHTFINFLMVPEVAAEITNATYFATANRAALPFVREELRNDPIIFPPQEIRDRLEFFHDIGASTRLHEDTFEAVKAQ